MPIDRSDFKVVQFLHSLAELVKTFHSSAANSGCHWLGQCSSCKTLAAKFLHLVFKRLNMLDTGYHSSNTNSLQRSKLPCIPHQPRPYRQRTRH
jgi:hypothetical protein